MKKKCALFTVLFLACGCPVFTGFYTLAQNSTINSQAGRINGVVTDASGEPLIGASIMVKGTTRGVTTDVEGKFTIAASPGSILEVSYIGQATQSVKVTSATNYTISLSGNSATLDEVVVTALGIKKEKKSLGYSVDDINSEELMKNKSNNPINSLSGKIAGVNITQSSGAAGAGSQIILRGGTSLERDNQPLFVVDGVIYDNSTSVIGNSAFDGTMATTSTNSNRVMDINPEDIENMSVLKGPAAAALYGSRASAGVVIITTKKGKEGKVEVNLSAKFITSWVKTLPKTQRKYKRGYYEDQYNAQGDFIGTKFNDFSYESWGEAYAPGEETYNNIDNFFQNSGTWDTNLSVAGGNKNGSFYLSGSYFNQNGIIPTTGYDKATFRFNGDQKFGIFTFGANVAYSQANTDKTLTSAALYGSSGNGALASLYTWSPSDDVNHYLNEDGSRYRMFNDRLEPWEEKDNPNWILNKNKLKDNTERFTGNFNIKADITNWWWVSFRMGIDSYTTENSTFVAPGGAIQQVWQNGMMSENSLRFRYLSTNFLTNFNKQFGDFNLNLMLGTSTDDTKANRNYRKAWNFQVPGFYSFDNARDSDRNFKQINSQKRLVGAFGEFRADWDNTVFLSVTGRQDWTSTLPIANRSYFYPSVGGSIVFSEFLQQRGWMGNDILTFGKLRASWARVGKDTDPYVTNTYLWPVGTFLGGITGVGNSWTRGNPYLKPEITESTELGIELRFLQNRLKFDYAYYTNNSFNQILSPRGPQSTGYIFCSMNAGDVYNKGMELSISGTPIQNKDWTWETGLNISGNRGTVGNLVDGIDILYVTDVQVGNAKAASFNGGNFMAISGSRWSRSPEGKVILDSNGMPTYDKKTTYEIGNREPKLQGGFNNTLSWKNFTFNMLWEFRIGGAVYNGTQYEMTKNGVSLLSGERESITIDGVNEIKSVKDGKDVVEYKDVSYTFNAEGSYEFNGKKVSGRTVINDYYNDYYLRESSNFMTNVNSLRLRTISLSYDVPSSVLKKTKFIKRALVTVTGNNLLLFTNYNGDPEVAAAGAGSIGSSSVGMDYCGVPSTASMAFGVNLTF